MKISYNSRRERDSERNEGAHVLWSRDRCAFWHCTGREKGLKLPARCTTESFWLTVAEGTQLIIHVQPRCELSWQLLYFSKRASSCCLSLVARTAGIWPHLRVKRLMFFFGSCNMGIRDHTWRFTADACASSYSVMGTLSVSISPFKFTLFFHLLCSFCRTFPLAPNIFSLFFKVIIGLYILSRCIQEERIYTWFSWERPFR